MAKGRKWPKTKQQRCISEIKRKLKVHPCMKAMQLVSDAEEVPIKTLQEWFYRRRKQEAQVRAEKKKTEVPAEVEAPVTVGGEKSRSRAPEPSPAPPPEPARLLIDGVLKCSACSGQHLEQREGDYYCLICRKFLEFEGFYEEETRPIYTSGRFEWMV